MKSVENHESRFWWDVGGIREISIGVRKVAWTAWLLKIFMLCIKS